MQYPKPIHSNPSSDHKNCPTQEPHTTSRAKQTLAQSISKHPLKHNTEFRNHDGRNSKEQPRSHKKAFRQRRLKLKIVPSSSSSSSSSTPRPPTSSSSSRCSLPSPTSSSSAMHTETKEKTRRKCEERGWGGKGIEETLKAGGLTHRRGNGKKKEKKKLAGILDGASPSSSETTALPMAAEEGLGFDGDLNGERARRCVCERGERASTQKMKEREIVLRLQEQKCLGREGRPTKLP